MAQFHIIMQSDDRLFRLQSYGTLPRSLSSLLCEADTAYLRDKENRALELIEKIEAECQSRGIQLPDWETIERPLR